MKRQPHGEEGHCNIFERDHDSVITGRGDHDRVVAFQPGYCEEVQAVAIYVRIDHKWGLGMPTDRQVILAFKKDQGIRGGWVKALQNDWPASNATEQWYIKAR